MSLRRNSIGLRFIFVVLACGIFSQIEFIAAYEKIWLPNTNYNNPNNWDSDSIPCARERVIFPRDKDVSVFVQDGIFAREVILPLNGELILSTKSEIDIGMPSSAKCDEKDNHFIGGDEHQWYDASNWQINDLWGNLTLATAAGSTVNPVPQSHLVPCAFDDVVFPANSTFKVDLEQTTSVRSLTINGRKMATRELSQFFATETGRRQFKVGSSTVDVIGPECAEFAETKINGCTCDNEEPQRLSRICAHAAGRCPTLHCTDPVTPSASCCPVCGSLLTVLVKPNLRFWTFRQYIGTFFVRSEFREVSGYMFRTKSGPIQIVLTHAQPRGSENMAKKLTEDLSSSYDKLIYGITDVSLETSKSWFSGAAAYTGSTGSGMTSGNLAALVIGLIAATIIGILFYTQRHRLMPIAFAFGRFENEDDFDRAGGLEMAVEMSPTIDISAAPPTPSAARTTETIKGFDNPFYDPKCTDATAASKKALKPTDPGENPCYLAFERVEDIPVITSAWPSDTGATPAPIVDESTK